MKKTPLYDNTKDESLKKVILNIVVTQKKNNFIVSITNNLGEVLLTESPGTIGYSKSARKNFYTYQEVTKAIFSKIDKISKNSSYIVIFKGICKGKQSVINTLTSLGADIRGITSEVFFAKNGCRPKKQRRL